MSARDPEVWLVLPSASPERARATLPAWREMGYRIAVLQDRVRFECVADVVVHVDEYRGWAASVNDLARAAVPGSASVVVAAGDDMWPDPVRPAGAIAREFLERFPDTFGVMQPTGDEFNLAKFYCGSPWLGRAWLDRAYGGTGPLWPGYFHNWADMELHWVARCLGVLWDRPDVTQRHEHFSRAAGGGAGSAEGVKAAVPGYWASSAGGHDAADCALFVARSGQGFPGAVPVGGPGLDMELFRRAYRFIAETHLSRLGVGSDGGGGGDGWMGGAVARVRASLDVCAQHGWRRVAIYGAGSFTRALGAAWAGLPGEVGVEVVCVIDDGPRVVGGRLWNWPVVSMADAARLGVQGVVVSSNAHEEAMVERARGRFAGVVGVFGGVAERRMVG